jgi:uncharacterized protein YneR
MAKDRASSLTTSDKVMSKDEIDVEEQEVRWLREKAAMRSGYDEFCASRHRKLKNQDRVRFWAFAAGFSQAHYGFSSPIPVCKPCSAS